MSAVHIAFTMYGFLIYDEKYTTEIQKLPVGYSATVRRSPAPVIDKVGLSLEETNAFIVEYHGADVLAKVGEYL